jgi:peptide-methionine (S)-S-oxide reductase
VFDPSVVSYADLVKRFFEVHDPTQGMRQGNDIGTQYRSAIYWTTPEQEQTARELTKLYGDELARRRLGDITTEIRPAAPLPGGTRYYYAEDAHQQYLAKNPFGYRCHANTGVSFPA